MVEFGRKLCGFVVSVDRIQLGAINCDILRRLHFLISLGRATPRPTGAEGEWGSEYRYHFRGVHALLFFGEYYRDPLPHSPLGISKQTQ